LDTISDLAWCHVEQTRSFGLYPASLLQRSNDFFAFIEIGIAEVEILDGSPAG
jgi:hypothetical protein